MTELTAEEWRYGITWWVLLISSALFLMVQLYRFYDWALGLPPKIAVPLIALVYIWIRGQELVVDQMGRVIVTGINWAIPVLIAAFGLFLEYLNWRDDRQKKRENDDRT